MHPFISLFNDMIQVEMFKKFEAKESIVGTNQIKNSVQRSIRSKLIETYPNIEVCMCLLPYYWLSMSCNFAGFRKNIILFYDPTASLHDEFFPWCYFNSCFFLHLLNSLNFGNQKEIFQ